MRPLPIPARMDVSGHAEAKGRSGGPKQACMGPTDGAFVAGREAVGPVKPFMERPMGKSTSARLEPPAAGGLETSVEHPYRQIAKPTFYAEIAHSSSADERARIIEALTRAHDRSEGSHRALGESPAGRLAERMGDCCRVPLLFRSEDSDEVRVCEQTCKVRICPRCAEQKRRMMFGRITAIVEAMDDPRFLTLTLQSSARPLREQIHDLISSFRRMRQRKQWKRKMRGGVGTIEVTWNPKTHQWHPHIHTLVDGEYWAKQLISDEWKAASNGSFIVDIEIVHGRKKMAFYVGKYVSKGTDTKTLPSGRIAEFATAMHGVRLLQTFGESHAVREEKEDRPVLRTDIIVDDFHHMHRLACNGDLEAQRVVRWCIDASRAGTPRDTRSLLRHLAAEAMDPDLRAALARIEKPPRPPDPILF